jgi:hypothetical protein
MANSLRRVSVVMIALAASMPLSAPSLAAALSMPLRIFAIGSRVPMRPVEQTSHSRGLVCVTPAACSIIALASVMPPTPVQAFAQPELTTTPRILPLCECFIETFTGAALTALVVNVAATSAGTSETMSARSFARPSFNPQAMPAA